MTYFGFLLRFLVLPIAIFLVITWWDNKHNRPTPGFNDGKAVWIGILVHIILAVAYTTPWDNYLVATGVWYYNPDLVTGIVLGYVPIEEYTFFVLETILAGLWWWFLVRRLHEPSQAFKPNRNVRFAAFGITFSAWLIFTYMFFLGGEKWTYLSIIQFWALPAIFPQLLYGADILWHHRNLVFTAVFVPGLYLSLMDIVALTDTTWSISKTQTTGILFFGILPLEEVLFFFITNLLIAFGMTLLLSKLGTKRFEDWKINKYKGLP
ncbi:MAG TPA: lycopene cyclase domain-containing protein [Anaerolineales bacterium]|nr:lycopene cyclase domain-containing protein [Anaerolineales bacterium]HNN14479.1 lycopene cyclase domain-containing protein [Anaerolineales bacterium]